MGTLATSFDSQAAASMQKSGGLTLTQIRLAIWVLHGINHAASIAAHLTGAMALGLEELLRLREAIKKNQKPLSWADFVAKFDDAAVPWGKLLKNLEIEYFALGKLIAKAPDGIDWSMWLIFKDQLGEQLKKEFGIDFRIKIGRPE